MARLGAQTAGATTLPAPVGGLNDRDSLADMPATDAVILENWWPEPSKVVSRSGSYPWATGFTDPVNSLVEYSPPSGNSRLFACAGANIYDATNAGAIGSPVVTGQAVDKWQDVSCTTAGGSYLALFNGTDKPLLYDGATWTPIDASSTPAITGIDTKTLVSGCVFKNRLYMIERDSLRVWYLPVVSVGGAAQSIDFGQIFQRGGSLMAMYTWTLDAGNGSDDHAVLISSNGEVAVYAGSDPATAATWALVGVFSLGKPIGRRCGIKFGGDLLIVCEDGVYPLAKGLLSSSIDRRVSITDKIQNSINQSVTSYRANFGWDICLYQEKSAVILNVPAGNGQNFQFVQNIITGAWTKFIGWDAICWRNSTFGLFFGSQNAVHKAWDGYVDDTDMIVSDALQAFQYFGTRAQNKYFTMVRPYLQTTGVPSILYGLNGDFNPQPAQGVLTYTPANSMVWGSMVWGTMVWGGSSQSLTNWHTVGGIYKTAALRLKSQSNGALVEWAATDFIYNKGGLL